jgi:crotonyl-CoA carboxylase/reductase
MGLVVDSPRGATSAAAPLHLYPVGVSPPLGHVPREMHAWTLRRERHGPPLTAFVEEVVPTPRPGVGEVLIQVMAAGVNYNGVWAAQGWPVSPLDAHNGTYHIGGSDAAGIVWEVGPGVGRWRVGEEVVVHCNQDDGDDEECLGGDPMLSPSQRIWGYETSNGSFAQFALVQAKQLLPRPQHLSWAESGCYLLTLATVYRMLFGHAPHVIGPGKNILIWGAAGGLGSMALQLARLAGARAIGVVSGEDRADYVRALGAAGVIDRTQFDCWGPAPPSNNQEAYAGYLSRVRTFGRAVRALTSDGGEVDIVLEHPGQATFSTSCILAKRGGMVVFCAATSGFDLQFDARYVWMRQKRIQGSHFANTKQAAEANRLVLDGKVDPCLSLSAPWRDLPKVHQLMADNRHPAGNAAIQVQCAAPEA